MHLISPYDRAWRERQQRITQPPPPPPRYQRLARAAQRHALALICGFAGGFFLASFLPPLACPSADALYRYHSAGSSGLSLGPLRAQQ